MLLTQGWSYVGVLLRGGNLKASMRAFTIIDATHCRKLSGSAYDNVFIT